MVMRTRRRHERLVMAQRQALYECGADLMVGRFLVEELLQDGDPDGRRRAARRWLAETEHWQHAELHPELQP